MSYVSRILTAVERGLIASTDIADTEVRHDDSCAIFHQLECTCEPDVFISTKEGRFTVLPDGSVRAVQ